MNRRSWLLATLGLLAVMGCSSSGSESAGASYKKDGGSGYNAGASSGGTGGGFVLNVDAAARAADSAPLPPENEQNVSFLAPRAGARYVYVANPTRNTVSIIDSLELGVIEVAPGDSPTYVATVPGQDVALVINVGSHTLRVLRGTGMNAKPIPIVAKANAIAIAPDGLHAVIWFDAEQVTASAGTSSGSTSSAQEVSVVSLAGSSEKVVKMTVGYNPSEVVYAEDSTAAFVVADNGISELRFADITKDDIAPFTPYTSTTTSLARADAGALASSRSASTGGTDVDGGAIVDGGPMLDGETLDGGTGPEAGKDATNGGNERPDLAKPDLLPSDLAAPDLVEPDTAAPPARTPSSNAKVVDVSVTRDGSYAIARREATSELLLMDLARDVITSVALSSQVTDVDLMPSGTEAFAVLPVESALVRIPIPAGFADPTLRTVWPFESGTVGSVSMSKQGRYAVLYSTVTGTPKKVVILDLGLGTETWVDVQKEVRAVTIAPDEKTALVLHKAPTPTDKTSSGSAIDKAYGYTMIRLEDGFPKWQDTAADPNPFAITPSSSDVFVLLRDDNAGVRLAQRMSLTSFTTQDFPLGSPPDSIAALAETTHKIFVGQVHAEGRISFIDWQTGSVESVTGFALNGRIQQ